MICNKSSRSSIVQRFCVRVVKILFYLFKKVSAREPLIILAVKKRGKKIERRTEGKT